MKLADFERDITMLSTWGELAAYHNRDNNLCEAEKYSAKIKEAEARLILWAHSVALMP